MAQFTRSSGSKIRVRILTLALTLGIGIVVYVPSQVQAQLKSDTLSSTLPEQWELRAPRSPGEPAPVNTVGGASRGGCNATQEEPIPLLPVSRVGETVAEYPTMFWYMPQTSASAVEFLLRDAKGNDVYRVRYALAKAGNDIVGDPRIMSLTLPAVANLSPLAINQDYQWALALICNPQNRSKDIVLEGGIKRIELNPTLAARLQSATPQERVALYTDARLWYDTLTTLAELRRDRPNDNGLAVAWEKLLNSVGLATISKAQINRGELQQ